MIFETENKYPGAPTVNMTEISEHPFKIDDVEIIPIRVLHNTLPILGYRVDNFAYLTDVKTIPNGELEKLKHVDVLVLNALREEDHASHLSLSEALDLITIIQPKQTYLTHISHLLGFHKDVSKTLPKNVFLAYDELTLEF